LSSRFKTEEILRNGGSIKSHTPLDPSTTNNHGTFKAMVEARRWKSKAPTHNGSRSSDIKENNSLMRKEKHLMSMVDKIKKEEKLSSGADIKELTKDGELSILTKQRRLQKKALTMTSDSTSTDHSTLSLDFQ